MASYETITIEKLARKPAELGNVFEPSKLLDNWPWEANLTQLNSYKILTAVSFDAGSYVCESVYWSALNFRRDHGYPMYVAFFHVPILSTEWTANRISDALLISLDCLAKDDLK